MKLSRLLFALVLALLTAGTALAAHPNPGFDTPAGCSLEGWTTSGSVSVRSQFNTYGDMSTSCWAHVNAYTSIHPVSTLQTVLTVPSDGTGTTLKVRVIPSSGTPGTAYPAQSIKVYDQDGALIYSQSRNYHTSNLSIRTINSGPQIMDSESRPPSNPPSTVTWMTASIGLSGRQNQQITLVISANVNGADPSSPEWASLQVDYALFDNSGAARNDGQIENPETMPGGGW